MASLKNKALQPAREQCPTCKGRGRVKGEGGRIVVCPRCQGRGQRGYRTK